MPTKLDTNSPETLVMLSALQHYLFCPRQCALIHVEGVWSENFLTASGRQMHERVHGKVSETRKDVHLATSLKLVSKRLGLMGVADLVEFHRQVSMVDEEGRRVAVPLHGRAGFWKPFPVEYKRGSPKGHRADEVQLCAQALCIEEMMSVCIEAGALFYGEPKRRMDVRFDDDLRALTEFVATKVRTMLESGETPPPTMTKECRACSIVELCLPEEMGGRKSVRRWLQSQMGDAGI